MWYSGSFKCGHKGRVFFVEEVSEKIVDSYFGVVCDSCYLNQKDELQLPKLKGSEKQVYWAESVRELIKEDLEDIICKGNLYVNAKRTYDGFGEIPIEDLVATRDKILSVTSVDYFIGISKNKTSTIDILIETYESMTGIRIEPKEIEIERFSI